MSQFDSSYADRAEIIRNVSALALPPRNVAVSDLCQEHVYINAPGIYTGLWDLSITPYMREPMDCLSSRDYKAVVFVGPQRAGKTQALLDGMLAHSIVADPGDIGIFCPSRELALDYRKRRVERLHESSPEIANRLSPYYSDTGQFFVRYKNGMILSLGWPSSAQVAQRDLKKVGLSDFDSFPNTVGADGNPFDLLLKRIERALSRGMAVCESNPKRHQIQGAPPTSAHHAPPTDGGIMPIYNRGERRLFYWKCFRGCKEHFRVPALPLYQTDLMDPHAAGETAHVACTHCGEIYLQKHRFKLNQLGRWVRDGARLDAHGIEHGNARKSNIASFWLHGCAAAFLSWSDSVAEYVAAKLHADQTGDEMSLATKTSCNLGLPYRPRALSNLDGALHLSERKERQWDRGVVPRGARGLLAQIDVQGTSFAAMVVAHGVGNERWFVDRFSLREYKGAKIRPASYIEHWDSLIGGVLRKCYPCIDGRYMRIHHTIVDSGGEQISENEGATEKAYQWWRQLRRAGLAQRVTLAKGLSSKRVGSLIRISYPLEKRDGRRRGNHSTNIPVLLINSDRIKDIVHADLMRDQPGPGFVHISEWMPDGVLRELTAEKRVGSKWQLSTHRRNETWDLLSYDHALWMHLGGPGVDWENPPLWLEGPELNCNIQRMAEVQTESEMSFTDFQI